MCRLRSQKDIVRIAVKNTAFAYRYATDDLRNDPSFALEMIKVHHACIMNIGEALTKHSEFLLESAKFSVSACYYMACSELKKNVDFVSNIVAIDGEMLKSLDECMKNNLSVVLTAVTNKSSAIKYVGDTIKKHSLIKQLAAISCDETRQAEAASQLLKLESSSPLHTHSRFFPTVEINALKRVQEHKSTTGIRTKGSGAIP